MRKNERILGGEEKMKVRRRGGVKGIVNLKTDLNNKKEKF